MKKQNTPPSLMQTPDARTVADVMVEAGEQCKCGCRAARHITRRDSIGSGVGMQSRPCADCDCKNFQAR